MGTKLKLPVLLSQAERDAVKNFYGEQKGKSWSEVMIHAVTLVDKFSSLTGAKKNALAKYLVASICEDVAEDHLDVLINGLVSASKGALKINKSQRASLKNCLSCCVRVVEVSADVDLEELKAEDDANVDAVVVEANVAAEAPKEAEVVAAAEAPKDAVVAAVEAVAEVVAEAPKEAEVVA